MTKIERLAEPAGYSKKYTIYFVGGKRMKVEFAVIASMGLHSGMTLTEEQMIRLDEENGAASAKARAVRMLSASNLSEKELRRRLKQKGESDDHAERAVDWLNELNLIDDEQVAKQAVRIAVNKGYGKARIRSILYTKGIEKSLWEDAMAEMPEPDEAIDRFIEKQLKGRVPDQKETKRTVDALMRRGHNWSDIKSAMSRYTDSLDDYLEEQE